jgi:hypothetical protein
MAFQCLNCQSENIQRVKGLYESGIQKTETSSNTRGKINTFDYNAKTGVGVGTGSISANTRASGVIQSALSEKLAPPFLSLPIDDRAELLFSVILSIFVALSLLCFTIILPHIIIILWLVIFCIIIFLLFPKIRIKNQDYINKKIAIDLENKRIIKTWQNLYYCHRCDSVMDMRTGLHLPSEYLRDLIEQVNSSVKKPIN